MSHNNSGFTTIELMACKSILGAKSDSQQVEQFVCEEKMKQRQSAVQSMK